jgi:hypothetical protein
MSYNQKGKPWYRMPTFGLVSDIVSGTIDAQPGEGFLYDAFAKGHTRGMNAMDASMLMMVRHDHQVAMVKTDAGRPTSAFPFFGPTSKATHSIKGQPNGIFSFWADTPLSIRSHKFCTNFRGNMSSKGFSWARLTTTPTTPLSINTKIRNGQSPGPSRSTHPQSRESGTCRQAGMGRSTRLHARIEWQMSRGRSV